MSDKTLLSEVKAYTRTQLNGTGDAIADVLTLVRSLEEMGPLATEAGRVNDTLSDFQRKAQAWRTANPAPEE